MELNFYEFTNVVQTLLKKFSNEFIEKEVLNFHENLIVIKSRLGILKKIERLSPSKLKSINAENYSQLFNIVNYTIRNLSSSEKNNEKINSFMKTDDIYSYNKELVSLLSEYNKRLTYTNEIYSKIKHWLVILENSFDDLEKTYDTIDEMLEYITYRATEIKLSLNDYENFIELELKSMIKNIDDQ